MLKRVLPTFMVPLTGFTLDQLEGFPYQEWQDQKKKYEEQERWFTGAALDNQPQVASGKKLDLYPMRVNPIPGTVLKHAYAVFGEVEEDGRPLIVTKLLPRTGLGAKPVPAEPIASSPSEDGEDETEDIKEDPEITKIKMELQHGEEMLNLVWWENAGRAIMIEAAIASQIYGGCVFKSTYVPWEAEENGGWRQIPIRIERISPKDFIGFPDASDMYRLAEAWVVRKIDWRESGRWGYPGQDGEEIWYTEHWLPKLYEIRINGKIATKNVGGEELPLGGVNPFGFIPIVYIPHIRISDFLGINAFDTLKTYVQELNLRLGDFGDAINDDSHPIIAGRDLGALQMRKITEWLEIIDLGSTQGITGTEKPPDLFEVRTPRASTAMHQMLAEIWQQYCRDAYTPPVSYGEDEGSQRSSMTLMTRFWPLGSHVSTERYFWTVAMDVFQSFLFRMMAKKVPQAEITENILKARMKQQWASLWPRDRDANVLEWSQRSSNNMASVDHLIELAGDVEDIPEEKQRILKWVEDVERAKQKVTAEFAMQQQEQTLQAQSDMQTEQLTTQVETATIQAEAFKSQPKATTPQGGAKKRTP